MSDGEGNGEERVGDARCPWGRDVGRWWIGRLTMPTPSEPGEGMPPVARMRPFAALDCMSSPVLALCCRWLPVRAEFFQEAAEGIFVLCGREIGIWGSDLVRLCAQAEEVDACFSCGLGVVAVEGDTSEGECRVGAGAGGDEGGSEDGEVAGLLEEQDVSWTCGPSCE